MLIRVPAIESSSPTPCEPHAKRPGSRRWPAGAAAREPEARYDVAPDYIGMACTSAGVSLREPLSPDELVKALLTGKPPRDRRAHFVVLLEEAPEELLRGLVAQVGRWASPGKVAANLKKIAAELGVRAKPGKWLQTA